MATTLGGLPPPLPPTVWMEGEPVSAPEPLISPNSMEGEPVSIGQKYANLDESTKGLGSLFTL